MFSGDVLFDDAEIKSRNRLIDNSANELIELASAFKISRPIAVGIDAILVSTLDTNNSLKSLACCFLFSYFGSCSTY